MESILVTGASGFIGGQTVTALLSAGYLVTRGVRRAERKLEEDEIVLDLTNPSEILALERGCRFDGVVHLGAHVG